MSSELAILILAAGNSSRLGHAKQLVPYRGKPLLQHVIDHAKESQLGEVYVVLGAWYQELKSEISAVNILRNENWQQGMGSSVATGVAALSPHIKGVIILQCDQPYLSASYLVEFAEYISDKILISDYGLASGPPSYFPAEYFDALIKLDGEKGAKAIIKEHMGKVTKVPFPEGSIDIDTEEDLKHLFEG